ncbi:hypothetical protein ABZV93_27430 [Actinopolymorpha sp. NPDC004070]|uniref:hypothetical protein n=1 Tax=Actinopolymorpha sp. NPDC004070 TaxID=3154548 RepID=UPI0033ADC89B
MKVYVGLDPASRRRIDLTEVVATQAEAALGSCIKVDEWLNPRTAATGSQLLDR